MEKANFLVRLKHSKIIYLIMITIAAFGDSSIVVLFNKLSSFFPFLSITGRGLMIIFYLCCFFLKFDDLLIVLKKRKAYDVIIICTLFWGACFILYATTWSDISRYMDNGHSPVEIIFFYVPIYITIRGLDLDDKKYIMDNLWKCSLVVFALILYESYFYTPETDALGYNGRSLLLYDERMSQSYQVTLIALIFVDFYISKREQICILIRIIDIGIVTYCVFYVFAYGSRGTLFVLLTYVLYTFIKMSSRKSIIRNLILFLVLVLIAIYYDKIANYLYNMMYHKSINSRSLAWIVGKDKKLDDSGRGDIYNEAIELIKNGNAFGGGLYYDYLILKVHCYVHNLFLELLLQFGIIGVVIDGFIILKFIKFFIFEKKDRMFSVFVCYALIKLLISDSYLRLPCFWIALAILCTTGNVKKRIN